MKIHRLDAQHETQSRPLWNIRALGAGHQHWLDMVISSHERLDDLSLVSAVQETLGLARSTIAHLLRDPLLPEVADALRHKPCTTRSSSDLSAESSGALVDLTLTTEITVEHCSNAALTSRHR